ncbi:Rieske 2Fe-2S domain-containing protein [Panacibacter sp. DH6]|uniref:Rieske 2Fe-2S domain-containing protein n=1 Tax=Panacibacter microcysteis TaxID=2793269 RepID=A0A931E6C4_9BACT|nr:Rieske 2Fe-2S domain-containing protein [Panacibacter microcysteis]MBG9375863.1 Rieske 2Fe-2S domain-containing protein [Panacibacter microcysteis]
MNQPTINWYKIAESVKELDFNSNNLLSLSVNKKKVTIGIHKEKLFACGYTCPHAGGVFADGHIDAMGNIVCPLHHYKFSMQTGRNVTGEGYALKTYEVAVKEDGVYIGMEEKKLFGLF